MINKIKAIHNVQSPYPLVININEDELVNLDVQIKSGSTNLTVTDCGPLVISQDGAELTSALGTIYNGRATIEIGRNYSTLASLPAGKYEFVFSAVCGDVTAYITGTLVSKAIPVGAVRNSAVESNVAAALAKVEDLPETYLGINDTAVAARVVDGATEPSNIIYVDDSVFPALPKMDRVEYEAQSTVASYNHVSHDVALDTLLSAVVPVATLPFRRLSEAEKTLVIAGDVYAHNMDDANKIYVSAYAGGIDEYTGIADWWYSLDNMGTLSLHSSLVSDGYTTSPDSTATAAMELADPTKWYKVFNVIKDSVPYQYVISADKTSTVVTYTLAFVGD